MLLNYIKVDKKKKKREKSGSFAKLYPTEVKLMVYIQKCWIWHVVIVKMVAKQK